MSEIPVGICYLKTNLYITIMGLANHNLSI